jgi:DNA-binding response OmpR family regulator
MPHTILLAGGDRALRDDLCAQLAADGFDAVHAPTADWARQRLQSLRPALLLLAPLPADRYGGRDFLAQLRDGAAGDMVDPTTPVILLSGDLTAHGRIRGFEAGADDVVSLPPAYLELRARIRVLVRLRENASTPTMHRVGPLAIDHASRQVRYADESLELSNKEFLLLRRLVSEPTRVFTKQELLRDVWGHREHTSSRTLDSHACRLRAKLTRAGATSLVQNVWGVGYRLTDTLEPIASEVPTLGAA